MIPILFTFVNVEMHDAIFYNILFRALKLTDFCYSDSYSDSDLKKSTQTQTSTPAPARPRLRPKKRYPNLKGSITSLTFVFLLIVL